MENFAKINKRVGWNKRAGRKFLPKFISVQDEINMQVGYFWIFQEKIHKKSAKIQKNSEKISKIWKKLGKIGKKGRFLLS